jgi:hypothetical protein
MARLSGRIDPDEPSLYEALGLVFLCGGLALWLDVSLLLASMTLGAVVANLASHHDRPFHAIEGIEWPFLIVFFVLAGAALDLDALAEAGPWLVAYVVLRVVGRLLGGWLGVTLLRVGTGKPELRRMGLAMLPQAGVALGMALIAARHFPDQVRRFFRWSSPPRWCSKSSGRWRRVARSHVPTCRRWELAQQFSWWRSLEEWRRERCGGTALLECEDAAGSPVAVCRRRA